MGKATRRKENGSSVAELDAIRKEIREQGERVREIAKEKDNLRLVNEALVKKVKKLENELESKDRAINLTTRMTEFKVCLFTFSKHFSNDSQSDDCIVACLRYKVNILKFNGNDTTLRISQHSEPFSIKDTPRLVAIISRSDNV